MAALPIMARQEFDRITAAESEEARAAIEANPQIRDDFVAKVMESLKARFAPKTFTDQISQFMAIATLGKSLTVQ